MSERNRYARKNVNERDSRTICMGVQINMCNRGSKRRRKSSKQVSPQLLDRKVSERMDVWKFTLLVEVSSMGVRGILSISFLLRIIRRHTEHCFFRAIHVLNLNSHEAVKQPYATNLAAYVNSLSENTKQMPSWELTEASKPSLLYELHVIADC